MGWPTIRQALAEREPDGYFEAAAVFNQAGRAPGKTPPPAPRSVLVMLDTSLSMQFEKLDRAYEATEGLQMVFEYVTRKRKAIAGVLS